MTNNGGRCIEKHLKIIKTGVDLQGWRGWTASLSHPAKPHATPCKSLRICHCIKVKVVIVQ